VTWHTAQPLEERQAPAAHGILANWQQFALLLAVTAFIGGMAGLERTVVPLLAQREFGIASAAAATSFLASFGLAKALSNLFTGGLLARTVSTRGMLVAGWVFALPVPLAIIWAPAWGWIVAANALLGVQQGITWSLTINMHVDLAGPRGRGLALGLNETAGYVGVAAAAFVTGLIAQAWGVRPEPFYLGIVFSTAGLALAALMVRDTGHLVAAEALPTGVATTPFQALALPRAVGRFTFGANELRATSLSGFVNNLNDGMAWSLLPIFLAGRGLSIGQIAAITAAYPLVWGVLQTPAGWASDHIGRRVPIIGGMVIQGAAIVWLGMAGHFTGWLISSVLLGVGTALIYPTLLAAVSDAVSPFERPAALGVYRFWRDSGTLAGALLAGLLADVFGYVAAIETIGIATVLTGLAAACLMKRRVD